MIDHKYILTYCSLLDYCLIESQRLTFPTTRLCSIADSSLPPDRYYKT